MITNPYTNYFRAQGGALASLLSEKEQPGKKKKGTNTQEDENNKKKCREGARFPRCTEKEIRKATHRTQNKTECKIMISTCPGNGNYKWRTLPMESEWNRISHFRFTTK